MSIYYGTTMVAGGGFSGRDQLDALSAQLSVHDWEVKERIGKISPELGLLSAQVDALSAQVDALSARLETFNTDTAEKLQVIQDKFQVASNCLEYASAISWKYPRNVSGILPWDAQIILHGYNRASLGIEFQRLSVNNKEASGGIWYPVNGWSGETYNKIYDIKAGSAIFVQKTARSTDEIAGYIIPYSYGYSLDSDSAVQFSLESVINSQIPAGVSELFDEITVYGIKPGESRDVFVQDLTPADMTTEYNYIMITAKAKLDMVQMKSFALNGYYGVQSKYLISTKSPSETLVKDVNLTYSAAKSSTEAKNLILKAGEYCYIQQDMRRLGEQTSSGYKLEPTTLTYRNGQLVVQKSDIVIWQ